MGRDRRDRGGQPGQDLQERVEARVNGERPEGGPRLFGHERRGPWS